MFEFKVDSGIVKVTLPVHVDFRISPRYPKWMDKLCHPELRKNGVADIHLSEVKLKQEDDQKHGLPGGLIHERLLQRREIGNHFGLRELEEIRDQAPEWFMWHAKGAMWHGWRDVMLHIEDVLMVPCLVDVGKGRPEINWHVLDNSFGVSDIALTY